ncbi:hypothetical protein A7Q09_07495 [Methylacidiphilum sp. Yel]|nr:hypothetical protein A7Q09_07495 [Methylacidiphilum sp. Yel]
MGFFDFRRQLEYKAKWRGGLWWWLTSGFRPARPVRLARRCRKKCLWLFESGDVRTVEPSGPGMNAASNFLSYGLAALSGPTARAVRMRSLWRGRLWLGSQGPSETSIGEAGSQLRTCVTKRNATRRFKSGSFIFE